MMERARRGDDIELSHLARGMWRLGNDADMSPGRVQARIEDCLEQGITTLGWEAA